MRNDAEKYLIRSVQLNINDILSRIGLEYECARECWGPDIELFDRTRIYDKLMGVRCELDSVGTGVQRLFGMAQKFAEWHDGVLAIEEPESNVNERQIAALTRTMVEEALNDICPVR